MFLEVRFLPLPLEVAVVFLLLLLGELLESSEGTSRPVSSRALRNFSLILLILLRTPPGDGTPVSSNQRAVNTH